MANEPSGTGRSPPVRSTVVDEFGEVVVGASAAVVVVTVVVVLLVADGSIDVVDSVRSSGLLVTDPSLLLQAARAESRTEIASRRG